MKIFSLIDSFKGTLSSKTLGEEMTKALKKKNLDAFYFPIADGGEGFLDVISYSKNVRHINCDCLNPLGEKINAYYLSDEKTNTAYIEMAQASGLTLLESTKLNPFLTNTYGFGMLIDDAIKKKIKNIIIGIGGSATNDCGVGMLAALGVKFYNRKGQIINNLNNNSLQEISYFDYWQLKQKIKDLNITVLSDVENPILGENGATYSYAPQKGARAQDLPILENNIASFAHLVQKTLNIETILFPGGGAAGGVGFALKTFFKPKFVSGINYLLDLINFDNLDYDLLITGEGKIDFQSFHGKAISGIIKRAKNKKIILVCAINDLTEKLQNDNVIKIYSIVNHISTLEQSLKNPLLKYQKLCAKVSDDISSLKEK